MQLFKSKKFIIIAILGIAIIGGTIGGTALANNWGDHGPAQAGQPGGNLERVCEIYQENTGDSIDCEALQEAFQAAAQERAEEMRANMEQAREEMQQRLIDEGVITQEQLDELEAWMEARPERGATQEEFQAWLEARPDIDLPIGPGGNGGQRGMVPFGGFAGPRGGCAPRFGGEAPTNA